jgi:plasmid segregation protein ParM
MKLFALDLGNRQVKLMSEKSTKVLPSYFVDATEYGNRDVLSFAKSEAKTHDYVSSRDSEFTYVWGEGLDVSGKFVTDTIGFSNRYNSQEFRLLTDFALAELASDFKESTKGILDVVVVTGVPTEDYENDDTIKQITSALKGVHSASIDGVSHVVRVHDVYVLMQPVGTAIDVMVDAQGGIIEENDVEDGFVGIVDVGGGTVLVDAFDRMNLDAKNRTQLEEGAYSLYTAIKNRVTTHNITEHEVERMVKDGNDREIYMWSPNGRETIDLTNIVMTERKRYTRKIASAVKTTYKSIARMKKVYVTGGTANLLIRAEFERVVPIAEFVADSETANVRGFYKYGIINEVTNVDEDTD